MQTLFTETPTAHSVKPGSFYNMIRHWFAGPRLDVFARQVRPGFDGWGDEYGTISLETRRPRSLDRK